MPTFGYAPEAEWPYADSVDDEHFAKDPRGELAKEQFITLERPYKLVPRSVDHFKAALSNKQMVAFGFTELNVPGSRR